ncbi:hypothetical protein [Halomicrococcus sp. NG-SE-24]|uniref:hypothetical protein n=1 Tax=Halomicrococcus sp. NG-SE-24 TaxID=3436928 RepID=UPI003D995966
MANQIKQSGDGLALQTTKPARTAGLVEEDEDGNPERQADVRVFAFDGLLLLTDVDRVDDDDVAELAATAARDTSSLHRVMDTSIQIAGNGYQVQLPPAKDAGFRVGDQPACTAAPNMLVLADGESERLAADLETIRREQFAIADNEG